MKICRQCGQHLADETVVCPDCGSQVDQGLEKIDDYNILEVVHKGYSSSVCRARRDGHEETVALRVFSADTNLTEEVAYRLKLELEEMKNLPGDRFVHHRAFRRSEKGLWYRVSDWVEAETWGDLMSGGELDDRPTVFRLFSEIATSMALLHAQERMMPHLIAADVLIVREGDGHLRPVIDYKISRFMSPQLDRPRPMLARVLKSHPDILNQRGLDKSSDIWSLGKLFVEVLTADFENGDYISRLDELDLPDDARSLLKTMLAEEPALRPRQMSQVAERLSRLAEGGSLEEERAAPAKEVRSLARNMKLLVAAVCFLAIIGVFVWYQTYHRADPGQILEDYAEKYAPSVAMVVVEYWLELEGNRVYANRSEGTAFLVDRQGHLLTNRHVACPWLEDPSLQMAVSRLRQIGQSPTFGYQSLLWFEGQRAFNRSARLMDDPQIADLYFTETALASGPAGNLEIAAVARAPQATRQMFASPLQADFAVLRIAEVPPGLKPLPLARDVSPKNIPRLSSVVVLGFPLGSQTPGETVNVSVTQGRVRRTFEDLIQIDASFYSGNSGGPVINEQGMVIGLAAGVASQRSISPLFPATPFWHMALVQPIRPAALLLSQTRSGQAKWNGVLDLAAGEKVAAILARARQGLWADAVELAEAGLAQSTDPSLVLAAAFTHFCIRDYPRGRELFQRLLSMETEEGLARLMLFLTDWLTVGQTDTTRHGALLEADWRSPEEFYGHLARVVDGRYDPLESLESWENEGQRAWLECLAGMQAVAADDLDRARTLLRRSLLSAGLDDWVYLIARAWLERVRDRLLADAAQDGVRRRAVQAESDAFEKELTAARQAKGVRDEKLAAIYRELESEDGDPDALIPILDRILDLRPDNRQILAGMAFATTSVGKWGEALEHSRSFLSHPGRPSSSRLSTGLLEPILLRLTGDDEASRTALTSFRAAIGDPWYRSLAGVLEGRVTARSLAEEAGKRPENLVTLQSALGLWAEAEGQPAKAQEHYKLALESFLDDWLEYNLARERLRRLRKAGAKKNGG